jgi:two-component system sensor histidine kinase KdpD
MAAAARYAFALFLVASATVVSVIVDQAVQTPNLALIFVLPVVIAAVSVGWGPAIVAAVVGVLAVNFFLIPPRYSLDVASPANVWGLVLLLLTAAIVSTVAAQARRRAMEAWAAADQALALQAMARAMTGALDREAIARAAAEALGRLFKSPAVVLIEADGELTLAGASSGAGLGEADQDAARWVAASRLPARGQAYPAESASFDFWPVLTPLRRQCVIGVRLSDRDEDRPSAPEQMIEIVGGYLAVAIDRDEYARQALESRVHSAGERLKADLLAAVSHDLKTPLSTILLTLQSLRRFASSHDAATQADLLALAEAETARLSGLVGKLLDMSRIEAGAVAPAPRPVAPDALVKAALERAAGALAGHRIFNEVDASAPLLNVDASLFEAALGNVLENAGKYSPPGSDVVIRSGAEGEEGWIEVLDSGPGFGGEIEPLFEKFARGEAGDGRPPGTGLGLSIARAFMEAQGGGVQAENRPRGQGARVRLWASLAPPGQAAA